LGKVRIPYYAVRKGRGYWLPSPKMKVLGFTNIRCGANGPQAWAIAEDWNDRWQKVRVGGAISPSEAERRNLSPAEAEELAIYPEGSIGYAFRRYRRMPGAWAAKAAATRNDWWRGWKRIKPIFADVDPLTITPEMMGEWYEAIYKRTGLSEAHRALKIWRALWKIMAAFRLCEKHQDPSLTIRNRAPKGRSAIFTEGQVVRLVKRAWRMKHNGLACIMASAWDTAFSPVDCRTVAPTQWFTDKTGSFFVKCRQKVEDLDEGAVQAIGTLSRRTERLIEAYLAGLSTELLPEAPMFRNQKGTAYSKDALCRSFRKVLKAEFPGDTRKLMDFRRSGSQEAQAGDVSSLALATKLANSINQSKRLQDTYLPKRAATVRIADEARKRGRQKLRAERPANEKLKLAGRDS
jgi:hypothetical protein